MKRIDTHNHFLPGRDDGCRTMAESLACLQVMSEHGYTQLFCTPHYGESGFDDAPVAEVAAAVADLQRSADAAMLGVELRPGGEIRLSPGMVERLRETGIPSFGHRGKAVVCDIWEHAWPAWATRAVEWLQSQGLDVILAHPERMPELRKSPQKIAEIARIGLKFQGNLGPIAGADSADTVAAAEWFLQQGWYSMVATDGHRPSHMPARLAGLARVETLVGAAALKSLTETNPATLWV